MISVDIRLSASAKFGGQTDVLVDLVGALGTTTLNSAALVDAVAVDIGMSGTLTGGRDVLYGTLSVDVGLAGTLQRALVMLEDSWGWSLEDRPDTYLYLVHSVSMSYEDPLTYPPVTVYSMSVPILDRVSIRTSPGYTPPPVPAPAPPAPPEAPGDFPMPDWGGVTVRALHGIVVDMDTPTITDGIPHS